VISITQKCARAFVGQGVCGLTAHAFLQLAARCLFRFKRERRYRAAVLLMHPLPQWAAENAAALLLDAMLRGPLSIDVFQAAIGGRFEATSLASDLNAIWRVSDRQPPKAVK